MVKIPRWVSILLTVAGIVLCFGLLLVIRTFDFYTADVKDTGIAVWIGTPHVTPGDSLMMEVGLFGGKRAAIDKIAVTGEGITQDVSGIGKDWGNIISSKSSEVGQDSMMVRVPIPKDAPLGKTLVLTVSATGTIAELGAFSTFSDQSTLRELEIPVDILSPTGEIERRLFSGLRGFGALFLAFALFRFSYRPLANLINQADKDSSGRELPQSLATLAIGLAIVYCMAGIVFFAHPLRHATELLGDAWTFAFVVGWILIPPYAGIRLAGPAPTPPEPAPMRAIESALAFAPKDYREAVGISRPRRASVEDILIALGKIPGARVAEKRDEIFVTRKGENKERVILTPVDDEVGAGDIDVVYEGIGLAIDVAYALASVLGPLEITLDGVPIAVDGSRTQSEALHDWTMEYIARAKRRLSSL